MSRKTEFVNIGLDLAVAVFVGRGFRHHFIHLVKRPFVVSDEIVRGFKVKVGDFRSRLEAYAFLQEIKEFYKGYIIKDNIYPEPPEVNDFAPDDLESGDE